MTGWILWCGLALAGADRREGVGIGVSGGVSPAEPAFFGPPRPYPTLATHAELVVVRGGSVRTGRRGRVRRTPSHQRIGAVFAIGTSPTLQSVDDSNRYQGGGGVLVGGQWGLGDAYVSASMGLGIGVHHQWLVTPARTYQVTTTGPWLRPKLAVGVPLWDGAQLEVGPSFSTVVPLHTARHNGTPRGPYLGQVSLDVTFFVGSVSPRPR